MTNAEKVKRRGSPIVIESGMFLHGILTTPESLEELRLRLRSWFIAYLHQQDGTIKTGEFPNQIDLYEGLDDFLLHVDKQLNRP